MSTTYLDYLSFHTEKYQVSQEQLEHSRLNAAKLSPMVKTTEQETWSLGYFYFHIFATDYTFSLIDGRYRGLH